MSWGGVCESSYCHGAVHPTSPMKLSMIRPTIPHSAPTPPPNRDRARGPVGGAKGSDQGRQWSAAVPARGYRGRVSHDVLAMWDRIESWLKVNAPNSYAPLRPPAAPEPIAAAQAHMGVSWPEEVSALWLRHDGAEFFEVDGDEESEVDPARFLARVHLPAAERSHPGVRRTQRSGHRRCRLFRVGAAVRCRRRLRGGDGGGRRAGCHPGGPLVFDRQCLSAP